MKPSQWGQFRPSFLGGNPESDGRSMVAGPGIYICNRCVELAVEVLEKRGVPIDR